MFSFENEEFCIEPPTALFQKKDNRGLRAKFDDMVTTLMKLYFFKQHSESSQESPAKKRFRRDQAVLFVLQYTIENKLWARTCRQEGTLLTQLLYFVT